MTGRVMPVKKVLSMVDAVRLGCVRWVLERLTLIVTIVCGLPWG